MSVVAAVLAIFCVLGIVVVPCKHEVDVIIQLPGILEVRPLTAADTLFADITYMTWMADMADIANMADIADMADITDMAYLANVPLLRTTLSLATLNVLELRCTGSLYLDNLWVLHHVIVHPIVDLDQLPEVLGLGVLWSCCGFA